VILVLDASAALAWALPDERAPEVDSLLDRIARGQDTAVIPAHFFAEVFSGLSRAVRNQRIEPEELVSILADLEELGLVVRQPRGLWARAQTLAVEHRLIQQTYDALYLALAEIERLTFLVNRSRSLRSAGPPTALVPFSGIGRRLNGEAPP
jgi:predicted nucleic acid-binding protein